MFTSAPRALSGGSGVAAMFSYHDSARYFFPAIFFFLRARRVWWLRRQRRERGGGGLADEVGLQDRTATAAQGGDGALCHAVG